MDFILQTVFTHINPTPDQMKAIFQELCRKNEENETTIVRLQEKEAESQSEILRLRQEKDKDQIEKSKLRQENDAKAEKIAELERKYSELKGLEEQKISCSVCPEKLPPYSEWSSQLEQQGSRHSSTLYHLGLGLELGLKPEKSGIEIGNIWDWDTFADQISEKDWDTSADSISEEEWVYFYRLFCVKYDVEDVSRPQVKLCLE